MGFGVSPGATTTLLQHLQRMLSPSQTQLLAHWEIEKPIALNISLHISHFNILRDPFDTSNYINHG